MHFFKGYRYILLFWFLLFLFNSTLFSQEKNHQNEKLLVYLNGFPDLQYLNDQIEFVQFVDQVDLALIVNNADRTKINNEPVGDSIARLTSLGWHKLKVKRNVQMGTIECFIDDMENPILSAVDNTFKFGKIGIGSFDDTGAFSEIKLWGNMEQQ